VSIQRFIGGDNLFGNATLTAGAVRPANAIRRLTSAVRAGTGRVALSGPYTGAAAARIDVEILDGGTTPTVSEPVHTGAGTGTLDDLTALAGATAQEYTITLIDTGDTTAAARTELEGYTLTAQATGAGGNAIALTVDPAGLTYTATNYSLLEDLDEGTTETVGPQWDFATAIGLADTVPATAKRLCFGDDRSVIYRQWKVYEDGAWRYKLLPAIARTYKAGERVYEVTGSRSATLTDGVTPETYSNITTLRDLLVAIDAGSALVSVDTVPSAERTTDNLAAILDLRLRTDARVDWTAGEGSEHARGFINTSAGATASTEIITARCFANTRAGNSGLGRERWRLRGSVSGDLGEIVTGNAYTAPGGKFSLTVPTRLPDGYGEPRGDISADVEYAGTRTAEESEPPVCVDQMRLGPNAEDKTVTFVYQQRPTTDCSCISTPYTRLQNAAGCMALDETEEESTVSLPTEYATRLQSLTSWYCTQVKANTSLDGSTATGETGDLAIYKEARDKLAAALAIVHESADGRTAWDSAFSDIQSELSSIAGLSSSGSNKRSTVWSASKDYTQTAAFSSYVNPATLQPYPVPPNEFYVIPATRNGWIFRFANGQSQAAATYTTDSTEPTWPTTQGATVTDGTVIWEAYLQYWSASASIALDATIEPYNGKVYKCTTAGTTGSTEPNWPTATGATVTDGTVVWTQVSGGAVSADSNLEAFNTRFAACLDNVIAEAGELPDFLNASASIALPSGACWQDVGDQYWWKPEGHNYLPAFTNVEYVSAREQCDEDGVKTVQGTAEFAFVIKVQCPGDLKEGDKVHIHIGDAVWPATYQVDDELIMATLAAQPLTLSGGVSGSDTHTWSVKRSVDGQGTDYIQDLTTPALYDDGDVQFRLTPGGIVHRIGDAWRFCVSAPAYRWRKDSGAWSATADIADGAIGSEGLSLAFTPGACPAWVAGDAAAFDVLQPYAVGSAELPDDSVFAWDGTGCTLQKAITGTVDAVAIALHTLPNGATVTVADGASLNETIPWRAGPMVLILDTALTDPTLTITIADASGGSIGWLWAGESVKLSGRAGAHAHAGQASRQRRTRALRTLIGEGALNPRAARLAAGWRYTLDYVHRPQSAVDGFLDLIDWASEGRPIVFVPHADLPAEAELVRLPEQVELTEWNEYANADNRTYRLSLEMEPWWT